MLPSRQDRARFETTRRLIASAINEDLLAAFLDIKDGTSCLSLGNASQLSNDTKLAQVSFQQEEALKFKTGKTLRIESLVRPESLFPPVTIWREDGSQYEELDSGVVFQALYPCFRDCDKMDVKERIVSELRSSAAIQEKWLELSEDMEALDLTSSTIEWERALIFGHATHPMHRTLFTESPLAQIQASDIPTILRPALTFLSLSTSEVKISGPFKQLLQPLLEQLNLQPPPETHIIVPCLSQQIPYISARFPNAKVIHEPSCATALCNYRTIKLDPVLQFPFRVKLSLACYMTSAPRTITPWTACAGLGISELLCKLVPSNLWVFKEIAAVVRGQGDFDEAKHLGCILREGLESRAVEKGEVLVVAAALAQRSSIDRGCHAEKVFGLDTLEKKREWVKRYTTCLLSSVLPPLLDHGICLEAYGQNIVARFCIATKELTGFGVYDFGGIRLHIPTLRSQEHDLSFLRPDHFIACDELQQAWSKIHHPLFQSHFGQLIVALGLEREGGWEIVRETIVEVLRPEENQMAKELMEFLLAEKMMFKWFLRMKLEGKYRDVRPPPNLSN